MKATTAAPVREITDRRRADTMRINGRHVTRGTELTIDGIRGRCAFVQHVTHENGAEWVDVIVARSGRSRTVRPDAIRVVHTRAKTGAARAI